MQLSPYNHIQHVAINLVEGFVGVLAFPTKLSRMLQDLKRSTFDHSAEWGVLIPNYLPDPALSPPNHEGSRITAPSVSSMTGTSTVCSYSKGHRPPPHRMPRRSNE